MWISSAAAAAQTGDWRFSPASPSGMPTSASYADGYLTYAINGWVQLVASPTAASPAFQAPFNAFTVRRQPVLATLFDSSAGEDRPFVFVSGLNYLYKLRVPVLQVAQSRDMKRAACPSDSLIAEPVVQRVADSNASYTLGKDIVIVATAHECGDTTQNQVIALDAANPALPPIWVFNSGEYEVGKIHACLPDLERNRIHCVSVPPPGVTQNAVWSIDTNTGMLVWAAILDAGVQARPALGKPGGPGDGHLYVADMLGRVHVFDADDGTSVTMTLLPVVAAGAAPAITRDLTVGSDLFTSVLFAVDGAGQLVALYDVGSELIEAWRTSFAGGQRVLTEAVPISTLGKLFVGLSDGTFHQLNMSSGADESGVSIAVNSGIPAMAVSAYRGIDGIHRFVGSTYNTSAGTPTAQFRVPCSYGTACAYAGGVPITGSLSLSRSVVAGCNSVVGTVVLDVPAPTGGIVVPIGDTLEQAVPPASLTIPAGATSGKFTIKSSPVSAAVSGIVHVTLGMETLGRALTLRPMGLLSTSLSPATVVGGQPVVGTARLECKAGPGPITVDLSSSNPAIANPVATSIVVPQGLQSATFNVATNVALAKSIASISGTANDIKKSKTLTVTPAASVSPTSLKFGSVAVGATSATQVVTLTNKGAVSFSVTGISITGTAANWFAQMNNCPASLVAGASCTIGVTFKPLSTASKAAKLTIATSATSTPLSVSLSGTGI